MNSDRSATAAAPATPAEETSRAASLVPSAIWPEIRAALHALVIDALQLAAEAGAAAERARIAAIMNAPDAAGRAPFAWELAQSGMTHNAALEALSIVKLSQIFPPIDAGASLTH